MRGQRWRPGARARSADVGVTWTDWGRDGTCCARLRGMVCRERGGHRGADVDRHQLPSPVARSGTGPVARSGVADHRSGGGKRLDHARSGAGHLQAALPRRPHRRRLCADRLQHQRRVCERGGSAGRQGHDGDTGRRRHVADGRLRDRRQPVRRAGGCGSTVSITDATTRVQPASAARRRRCRRRRLAGVAGPIGQPAARPPHGTGAGATGAAGDHATGGQRRHPRQLVR